MTADDAGYTPEANAGSPSGSTEPASPPSAPGRIRRAFAAFRHWRRSRPFWGGLLMILAGLELLAIPLSGILIKGAIKFVVYIGTGGVLGVLIGVLLVTAGLVVWFNPTHRVFYGIAGIILGLLSFPASNLGGFILGMLLAIFGGAAAIAWAPLDAELAPSPEAVPAAGAGSADRSPAGEGTADHEPTRVLPSAPEPRGQRGDHARNSASGQRFLAIAAMPALLVAGMLTSSVARTTPAASAGTYCILGILCLPDPGSSPSPSPSSSAATPSASPSVSPAPSASPATPASPDPAKSQPAGQVPSVPASSPAGSSASASASHRATPSASSSAKPGSTGSGTRAGSTKGGKRIVAKNVTAPAGLTASSATSVMTAKAATLDHFHFVGIVNLPVAGAATEQTLEFTASSASLSGGVNVAVTQGGVTTTTSSSRLDFSGNMTLYSTKLCGDIYGITGQICFTPSTIDQVLLKVANVLTGIVPLSMTNVTTYQPVTTAGALQSGPLSLG